MAKKLFTLPYTEDYDFLLVGIFCAYRDYRLCFELNRALDLSLSRQDDLEMKMEKKGSTSLFSVFSCINADEEHYFVISNKGSNGHFLTEMKQVDYFLLVRHYSRYTDITHLLQNILPLKIVSSIVELNPNSIKHPENFLLVEIA